ncbi:MAG TPA: tetratricopeptide repeat protein [Terriglobia bacterium]|nr:tetratricopeptide repeat protein [Terriglobia bacterium]
MDQLRPELHVPAPARSGAIRSVLALNALVWLALPLVAAAQAGRVVDLNGEVRTDQGVAVKSATVRLETAEGELVDQRPVTTAGQFFFTNVPKARYVITVTADGFETYSENLNLAEGADQYDVSVNLVPATKVHTHTEPPALSDAQAPREAKRAYEKAEKAIAARKYGQARKELQTAVGQYPCYARAQTRLGLIMSQQKDYKGAEAAFRKSISCDAGYLDAYLELGQLLNAEKRFGESEPVLEDGLRQAPASWQFYYEAGVAEYGLARYDQAKQQFEKAKALTSQPSADLDVKLADVYVKEHSFQKAYASMQDYLKVQPEGPLAPRIKTIMKQMESSGVLQAQAPASPQTSQAHP